MTYLRTREGSQLQAAAAASRTPCLPHTLQLADISPGGGEATHTPESRHFLWW